MKNEYEKKASPGNTAFNVAFRDFLKAPVVKKIDASNYNGNPGSTIIANAKDDFRVAEVKLSIRTASGVLIEEGSAVLNPINRNLWTYTATQTNATVAGSVISCIATDLPGNKASLDLVV
ncbi:MAG: hypothetical protein ACHQEM_03570 [Chitinophagales bacterium]